MGPAAAGRLNWIMPPPDQKRTAPGLKTLLERALRALRGKYRGWRLARQNQRIARSDDRTEVFSAIYDSNHWGSDESRSGPGSTRAYTEALRRELPPLFARHGIGTVFDAPCGDFHWMPEVLANSPVRYLGGDIVPKLVAEHLRNHGNERTDFRVFDLVHDAFPPADLWFCRDCLFHLSYADICAALRNFAASGIRFALLTNHRNLSGFANHEIRSGGFRKLDLFASPFCLPSAIAARITEGGPLGDGEHEMCLW
jgi:hypothetical protein